jgi:hypothetical protein
MTPGEAPRTMARQRGPGQSAGWLDGSRAVAVAGVGEAEAVEAAGGVGGETAAAVGAVEVGLGDQAITVGGGAE